MRATDEHFNTLYTRLMRLYAHLNDSAGKQEGSGGNTVEKLMALEKEIFAYQEKALIKVSTLPDVEVTSESEEPGRRRASSVDPRAPFPAETVHDKHYTPTGMSALSVALIAYQKACSTSPIAIKTEKYAYFELASWKSNKLVKDKFSFGAKYKDADVVFVDNNPCVTEVTAPVSVAAVMLKMAAAKNACC